VDASVAVAFALAVTYPAAGNLGGGGFMMVRLRDGKASAIDYRETAPLRATRMMYLDAKGNLIGGEGSSTMGYRASGVPGTVAGMAWRGGAMAPATLLGATPRTGATAASTASRFPNAWHARCAKSANC
jgi:hypothetical protein